MNGHGFDRACPTGNIMIDGYHDDKCPQKCGLCGGSGYVDADRNDLNDYVMENFWRTDAIRKYHKKHLEVKRHFEAYGELPCRRCK